MPFPVENIREVCKERKTSIAEIERELKIGNGVIARWEVGKRYPPMDKVKAIADYLDVPISRLTGEKEKNPAPTNGDGMSEDEKEIIRLFRLVDPATRAAMLQLLRAAEAGQITQDAGEAK